MSSELRKYTQSDQFFMHFEQLLRMRDGIYSRHTRETPGSDLPEADLSAAEKRKITQLMRVNHSGEVCAQALYLGQALAARTPEMTTHLYEAAAEEEDHLAWCDARIQAMGGHTSLLNPAWYLGSLGIGFFAALLGDRTSLGFIMETEKQVEAHLESHLQQLPMQDHKTMAVLQQMQIDERAHGAAAAIKGGVELPEWARFVMKHTAKMMTGLARWI